MNSLRLTEPILYPVPSGENLGHQHFIFGPDSPQVAEGRCGYAGSNKAFSVERDSVWKEELLEPLPLFERRLHPEVIGARQNAFCERQDALLRRVRPVGYPQAVDRGHLHIIARTNEPADWYADRAV